MALRFGKTSQFPRGFGPNLGTSKSCPRNGCSRRSQSSRTIQCQCAGRQDETPIRRTDGGKAMRYVIIRDDDTNALTPISCLERLYRPFLERGMPVSLATIPEVAVDTKLPDGNPEGFLAYRNGTTNRTIPIGANTNLVSY